MRGVKRNAADAALDAAANAGAGAGAGAGVDADAAAAPASGAAAGLELQGGGGAGDDDDHGHDGGGGGGGDEGDGLGPMGDDDNLEDDDDDDGGLDDGSLVGAHPDAGLSGDGAGSASGGGGGGGGITVHHKPHNFRRKINIEFIEDRNRRHITFSKRKAGIMKKAYELSTLTGTQVLLLVASETGHVYTFATPKLQPLITKPEGKNLIQACLNTPDLPSAGLPVPRLSHGYDQPAVDNSALGDANEKMTRLLRVNQPGMLYNAYPGVAVGGMYGAQPYGAFPGSQQMLAHLHHSGAHAQPLSPMLDQSMLAGQAAHAAPASADDSPSKSKDRSTTPPGQSSAGSA